MNLLRNLWQDESAQGATEYILLLVVVVAVVIAFKGQISDFLKQKVDSIGGDVMNFK